MVTEELRENLPAPYVSENVTAAQATGFPQPLQCKLSELQLLFHTLCASYEHDENGDQPSQ